MRTDGDLTVAGRTRESCLVLHNSHARGCPTRTATATNAVCGTGRSTPVPATATAGVRGGSGCTYAKSITRRLGATRARNARVDRVTADEAAAESTGHVVAASATSACHDQPVSDCCSASTNIRGSATAATHSVLAIAAAIPAAAGRSERRSNTTDVHIEDFTRCYGDDASDTTTESASGPLGRSATGTAVSVNTDARDAGWDRVGLRGAGVGERGGLGEDRGRGNLAGVVGDARGIAGLRSIRVERRHLVVVRGVIAEAVVLLHLAGGTHCRGG